jgi:hypothetical protein
MANTLSPELLAQLFSQESEDPFLILVTLSHTSFGDIHLVNNSRAVVSNGVTFDALPMKIRFPVDDGESAREFTIEFDNVSLELIVQIRSVTTAIGVKLEMILASMPDVIQMSQEDLLISSIAYSPQKISAKIGLDSFLNGGLTSESYDPTNFPGLF